MSTGIDVTLGEVAASLVLVAIAIAVSFWRRTGLEDEIAIAVVRSFVQLIAIGYVIQAIFDEDSLWLVFALLAVMVVFGAFTARRAREAGPGRVLAAAGRPRDAPGARRSGSSSRSASSSRRRATWSRSAGW